MLKTDPKKWTVILTAGKNWIMLTTEESIYPTGRKKKGLIFDTKGHQWQQFVFPKLTEVDCSVLLTSRL